MALASKWLWIHAAEPGPCMASKILPVVGICTRTFLSLRPEHETPKSRPASVRVARRVDPWQ